jgi:hypothetical protein
MKPRIAGASSVLPPLYAAWMDELLHAAIPAETEATCDDCAMCASDGVRPTAIERFFDPRTKCCTYLPVVPNFLVGRILRDDDPASAAGRTTVEARLEAGVAVTPLGFGRPASYALLYAHGGSATFGHSRALRCPHYLTDQGGRCGMWRHRNATCATWFCKHVRGAVGLDFWNAVHQLLAAVEGALARRCVADLDPGLDALRRLFPPPTSGDRQAAIDASTLDGEVDAETYRAVWGRWFGREREFYAKCAARVDGLTWRDVIRIGGPAVQIASRLVREAYRALTSPRIPDRVVAGSFTVVASARDTVRLWSYRDIDPLEVPKDLLAVLHHFDGRPTAEALRGVSAEAGIELDPGLVRRLADFRILVPCASDTRKQRTPTIQGG